MCISWLFGASKQINKTKKTQDNLNNFLRNKNYFFTETQIVSVEDTVGKPDRHPLRHLNEKTKQNKLF